MKQQSPWDDPEYRHGYATAAIEQKLCWQLRVMRTNRGWSQKELSKRSGVSLRTIQRYEGGNNRSNGELRFTIIQKIAKAFDVAMSMELIPFSALLKERERLGENDLNIRAYGTEFRHCRKIKCREVKCATVERAY